MSASSIVTLKFHKKAHRAMLLRHIQANPDKTHWHPGDVYTLGGEQFSVNNLIIRRHRKPGKPQQDDRFEVFEPNIFASGTFGKLKRSIANLIIKGDNLLIHKALDLSEGYTRIAKYQDKKLAIREFGLFSAASPDEVKPLVLDDAYEMGTMIMTFHHGMTLEQILKADIPGEPGFLTEAQRYAYSEGVLVALIQDVTDKGIIHRDFKSANLMLLPSGKFKVIDYGLAKQAGEETNEDVGTPLYMSPEQWQWSEKLPTVTSDRSDAFAAGVILSEIWRHLRLPRLVMKWISDIRNHKEVPRDFSKLFCGMETPSQEQGLRKLINGLTMYRPHDRLSAHQGLKTIRDLSAEALRAKEDVSMPTLDEIDNGRATPNPN